MSNVLTLTRQLVRARERQDAKPNAPLPDDILEQIKVRLRPDQREMLDGFTRFNFVSCHRRWGKSYALAAYLWERAYDCPNEEGNYGYFAATRGQTFKIVWRLFQRWAKLMPGAKLIKSEAGARGVNIPTRNGGRATIVVEGINYTLQRGDGWDGVVLDEAGEILETKYVDEIFPALWDEIKQGFDVKGRENQFVILCGTPQGRNWFFRSYNKANVWSQGQPYIYVDDITGDEVEEPPEPWTCTYLPLSITKRLSPEQIKTIQKNMELESYLREFELDWRAAAKGSFFGKYVRELRNKGCIGRFDHVPGVPVHTSWDLGYTGLNVIWFVQLISGHFRWIDSYVSNEEDLSFYLDKILPSRRKRFGYQYGIHYFPHDADESDIAAGGSRMPTIKEAMRFHGMGQAHVVMRHNPKTVGRQAVIWALKNSRVNEARCEESLDGLVMYRRRPNPDGDPLGEPVLDGSDHYVDAFRQISFELYRNRPDRRRRREAH